MENLPGYKPLCFIGKKLYFYKKGYVYVGDNGQLEKVVRVYPNTVKDVIRLSSRLFRTEPKYAVPVNKNELLLIGQRKMLLVDVKKKKVEEIATSREGFSDPLNVCVSNKKWVVVWGDYGTNVEHNEINIYGLTKEHKVEIIYMFEAGKIRHIHNIISKKTGGYFIFTGDLEANAGIYYADALFSKVVSIAKGSQKYRAVVGFDTSKGLLYATDAVNDKNYIYLLNHENKIKKICALNGPCIYGTEHNGKYYFSTTVEPDESNKRITSWISFKRGRGILSDKVCLISVDEQMDYMEIMKFEKDIFPMKLMQYGAIQFPKGKSYKLWIYPIAVKKYDGVAIEMEEKL